jgi:hypothetical protein
MRLQNIKLVPFRFSIRSWNKLINNRVAGISEEQKSLAKNFQTPLTDACMFQGRGVSLSSLVAFFWVVKGGNMGSTHPGELLSHRPSPVSLCLKSGAFSFRCESKCSKAKN